MKRFVLAITVFFIFASLNSKAANAISDKPDHCRKHCRIDLVEIILSALESEESTSGLRWVEWKKTFALNRTIFTKYYQRVGNSSAKWESIKNKLTVSKSGFIFLNGLHSPNSVSLNPPEGYDEIYTYKLWQTSVSQQNNMCLPSNNNVHTVAYSRALPPLANPPIEARKPPEKTSSLSMPPSFLDPLNPNSIPWTLLRQQGIMNDDPFTSPIYNVSRFLEDFQKKTRLKMNDFDRLNFETLLTNAKNFDSPIIPTQLLYDFGRRFGPWPRIVANVGTFVLNGAADWFHGTCELSDANARLNAQQRGGFHYYLVCSVAKDTISIPKLLHVFTLSYRTENGIRHYPIFKDELDRLCMFEGKDSKDLVFFGSFKGILNRTIKKNAIPISHEDFKSSLKVMPLKSVRENLNEGNTPHNEIPYTNLEAENAAF